MYLLLCQSLMSWYKTRPFETNVNAKQLGVRPSTYHFQTLPWLCQPLSLLKPHCCTYSIVSRMISLLEEEGHTVNKHVSITITAGQVNDFTIWSVNFLEGIITMTKTVSERGTPLHDKSLTWQVEYCQGCYSVSVHGVRQLDQPEMPLAPDIVDLFRKGEN